MSKNVLIISASLRSRSNSEALARSFMEGAESAGHKVELVTLKGKQLAFCKGCLACQKLGHCVIADDADPIAQKMEQADVIVFATPVYYFSMAGQLKTLLDRCNYLFSANYKFRDIYALTAAAENEDSTPVKTVMAIEGWVECFEKARLAGSVFAGGVAAMGDIAGHAALQEAFEMGRKI